MFLVPFILSAYPAMAQDESTSEESTSEEVAALEEEKKLLELQIELERLRREQLQAQLPTGEVKGKEGGLTFDGKVGYFGKLLAYDALGAVGDDIADRLGGPPEEGQRSVFLTTNPDLVGLRRLHTVLRQRIDNLEAEQTRVAKAVGQAADAPRAGGTFESLGPPAAAIALAPEIIGGFTQIASAFRVDTTVGTESVALGERTTLAQIAGPLAERGWSVRLWHGASVTDTVLTDLADRTRVQGELEAVLASLDLEGGSPGAVQLKARIDALRAAVDDLNKQLYEVDEGPTLAERLTAVAGLGNAPVLWVRVESAGQQTIVTEGAFRTVLSTLGGVACSFVYLDGRGRVLDSGTLTAWEGRRANARRLHRLRRQR